MLVGCPSLLGLAYLWITATTGGIRVSQVLAASLHAYHALRWTPADPREPGHGDSSVWASSALKLSPSALAANGAVSSFRECGLPYGLRDSLCTLQPCRSVRLHLLHSCNTQYEWLARPYSAGTFTLQEAPSFAWRTNSALQLRRAISIQASKKALQLTNAFSV